MIPLLFSAVLGCYGLATFLLLAHLGGVAAPLREPARAGRIVLLTGAVLHAMHIIAVWAIDGVGPFDGIAPTLSCIAWLTAMTFLFVRARRPRLDGVGAALAPALFVLVIASRFASRSSLGHSTVLALHVGANMLGTAAATLAFSTAIVYLLQERQLKGRHLGPLFRRLPPLDLLDAMQWRAVLVTVPALTVGLVTGHIVAARAHHGGGLPWQQYFGMIAWLLFSLVALLRVAAGWRGRRAAIGTMVGFVCSALVLAFYSLREGA